MMGDDRELAAERLRLAVESADIGTWDFYPETGVLEWSRRCRELFGLTPDEPVDYEVFLERIHPEDRQMVDEAVRGATSPGGKGEYAVEYRTIWPDGTLRWIDARGRAFFSGEPPKAVRFIGTVFDITHSKLAEQTMKREKDEFIAAVSHELRTPMTAILGWSRMLRMPDIDAETTAAALDAIERSTRVQSQLIEDLLDLSRIDTGKLHLDRRQIDLMPLVNSAVDAIRPLAEPKNIRIDVDLPEEGVSIYGDANRLQQVLWNLLTNATKFTHVDGRIVVRLERSGSLTHLSVQDDGIGIEPEFQPHIFDRFRQGSGDRGESQGGLGLGLAIVRHFVEVHGGYVRVESEGTGQGSTFIVTLPVLTSEDDAQPPFTKRDEARRHVKLPSLDKVRVAVVEDDHDTAKMIERTLKRCGAEVRVAHNAPQAIAMFAQWTPDVAIIDIVLPEGDGYDVITWLHSNSATMRTAVMALTVLSRADDVEKITNAGFDSYRQKPLEPTDIAYEISRLQVRRHQGMDPRAAMTDERPHEVPAPSAARAPKPSNAVLVVDDDASIRALVQGVLRREGIETAAASNGAEALELIAENDYAVIVLDLMMPVLDGFTVIEKLRNEPQRRRCIIVASAGDEGVLAKVDREAVFTVIRKPFNIDALIAAVKQCAVEG
ncbi:MAG TPA: response regulator [Thermoanaerobaculia bacterium]|jgi:PAS domain S-box-containing protein